MPTLWLQCKASYLGGLPASASRAAFAGDPLRPVHIGYSVPETAEKVLDYNIGLIRKCYTRSTEVPKEVCSHLLLCKGKGPRACHRLDFRVAGPVVVATSQEAMRGLACLDVCIVQYTPKPVHLHSGPFQCPSEGLLCLLQQHFSFDAYVGLTAGIADFVQRRCEARQYQGSIREPTREKILPCNCSLTKLSIQLVVW